MFVGLAKQQKIREPKGLLQSNNGPRVATGGHHSMLKGGTTCDRFRSQIASRDPFPMSMDRRPGLLPLTEVG